ncbi:UNVERIFIED_CONTAM: hypothetical protein PYX00_005773 [Menopon gallinae]|uniref:Alpha-1,3-glucosyltransferase n=1 Tax=Menopon gallinae TaxID=328185 RepID=A0AAW2HUK7_9NEOP
MFWFVVGIVTCLKLLLIPAYRSTDFEVHRNWLAITYRLPISKWYYENTSEWTLDYPPLFAWFEFILSLFAKLFDENMLKVENLNYQSSNTVLFQRLSVIISDLVYAYGTKEFCTYLSTSGLRKSSKWSSKWRSPVTILQILLFGNIGLMIVDHIHFQYNGFLFGILLISISKLFRVSFGPFIAMNQIPQVMSRLFPFKRGLCHAYWAPNFWAIYNAFDKATEVTFRKLGYSVAGNGTMTKGLVQDIYHSVLPNVTPKVTFALTVLSMLPCLLKLWRCPGNPLHFIRCLVICGLSSFLFGWHVHEKAILMSIIPLSLIAVIWQKEAQIFILLSVAGHYSLHPLLFNKFELPIKFLLILLHCVYTFTNLSFLFDEHRKHSLKLPLLTLSESLYVLGFLPLFLLDVLVIPVSGIDKKLPFLNLLLTSLYCSLGVCYCWFKYYSHFLTMSEINHKRKAR